MDPYTYCIEALDELRTAEGERATDPDALRRWSVLAYLARQPRSKDEFIAELRRLRREATQSRRPAMEAAVRAILRDWEARTQGHA